LVAKDKGFYEDEGLDVEIAPGTSTREGSFD
jgi:ABC-type nitrate/sulfonate/bicarbonate transport system substrate-binding protein